jgi:hypothetical protein
MRNDQAIHMFRKMGNAESIRLESDYTWHGEVIEEYAETVASQMLTNGCSEPHLRPVRVSYFEPGYAEGYSMTLYAYYSADGDRLTPAFENRWDAMMDLIYRYGDMSAQALRWTDAMAGCVNLNNGEQAVSRRAAEIRGRLEQAVMLLANPLPLTQSLIDDSHLIPLF